MADLGAAGLPAGPVYSPQQALDDPQAAAMGFLKAIDDYPGLSRAAPVPDLPVRFSGMESGICARPPLLGEHTDQLLGELGYTAAEITALRVQEIV
jgi:crotonobetainyl-CoA:carnitine CoA-transferase CaiB-like acyl-CoA transferase